jgi:hypothetical protein
MKKPARVAPENKGSNTDADRAFRPGVVQKRVLVIPITLQMITVPIKASARRIPTVAADSVEIGMVTRFIATRGAGRLETPKAISACDVRGRAWAALSGQAAQQG